MRLARPADRSSRRGRPPLSRRTRTTLASAPMRSRCRASSRCCSACRCRSRSHRQRQAAVGFAVEDLIAEPLEASHVVLGPELAPGEYLAVVVQPRASMDAWAARAERPAAAGAGRARRCRSRRRARCSVREADGRVLVRRADGTGYAARADDVRGILARRRRAADRALRRAAAGRRSGRRHRPHAAGARRRSARRLRPAAGPATPGDHAPARRWLARLGAVIARWRWRRTPRILGADTFALAAHRRRARGGAPRRARRAGCRTCRRRCRSTSPCAARCPRDAGRPAAASCRCSPGCPTALAPLAEQVIAAQPRLRRRGRRPDALGRGGRPRHAAARRRRTLGAAGLAVSSGVATTGDGAAEVQLRHREAVG